MVREEEEAGEEEEKVEQRGAEARRWRHVDSGVVWVFWAVWGAPLTDTALLGPNTAPSVLNVRRVSAPLTGLHLSGAQAPAGPAVAAALPTTWVKLLRQDDERIPRRGCFCELQ